MNSGASTHPTPEHMVQLLTQRSSGERPDPAPCSEQIPASAYTDQSLFERELEQLFLGRPLIIGHETQLAEPGDSLVFDWLGLPLITMRDKQGEIGTFMNVCRHRGMRLVQDEGQTSLRSLVCPYHQWTYGLDGELRNIPRAESFTDLDTSKLGLVRLPTEVRHGLIWVQATRDADMDLDKHLAGLGRDLERFKTADFHFCRQHVRTIDCNWKLIQDAFLDGYHVTRLHKNTVGGFFPDAVAESDLIGEHVRSAVARNEIAEAVGLPPEQYQLRHHCTFSYTVFPASVLIFHPDYTSIISLFPQSPDKTVFAHTMLTPHAPRDDAEREHFERSFELIDMGVFEAEDIFVSVGAQRGMRSGANEHLIFGGLEESAIQFHRKLREALS